LISKLNVLGVGPCR